MAAHTAALFGVLGVALLGAAFNRGITGILWNPYAGGILARKIVLAIVVLIPLFGLARIAAERRGYVSSEFGTAVLVLVAVTVFTLLALGTAARLNEVDRKRQETESALISSEKLATAGRMAAAVAHEINNPLEAISNLLYLLQRDEVSTEARREYLQTAERELNRVAAIARRTLGFYREHGRPSEVDVCELIDSTLEIYNAQALQKKVNVRKSYCEHALALASPGELRQVIANLISNALDALPQQGGWLELAVRRREQQLVVEVSDNGHGIQPSDLEQIFEPFFSTRKGTGTGLGLWITRELVTKNRGSIEVDSFPGGRNPRTSFRVSIPGARDRAQSATERA
jgi:signal transduction histidine kinase